MVEENSGSVALVSAANVTLVTASVSGSTALVVQSTTSNVPM